MKGGAAVVLEEDWWLNEGGEGEVRGDGQGARPPAAVKREAGSQSVRVQLSLREMDPNMIKRSLGLVGRVFSSSFPSSAVRRERWLWCGAVAVRFAAAGAVCGR